jgi:nitroimidazol reductase NimA-like FMN-containing flavoprotein (pyridoxamine 5'-phosphate oxidase superfamily)
MVAKEKTMQEAEDLMKGLAAATVALDASRRALDRAWGRLKATKERWEDDRAVFWTLRDEAEDRGLLT